MQKTSTRQRKYSAPDPVYDFRAWIIRKALPVDIPLIQLVDHISCNDAWSKNAFMKAISSSYAQSHLWAAIFPVQVATCARSCLLGGYICFHWLEDELYIVKLTVSPLQRKKGIASSLMESSISWAKKRKGKRIVLDVERENVPALNLYKKWGFRKTGPSGKKAWIMELKLNQA